VQRSFDDLLQERGTPLWDVTFAVVDLETTGGAPAEDRITEIGAVKVRGGECLGTFQTLVNPGRAIPPQITVLTGISECMVATAPRIETVLPALSEFIGDAVVVGHNVRFDVGFLDAALTRRGDPRLRGPFVDTCTLARRLVRDEVPDCRLGTLASRYRLDHRPSHRALDDALATADLLHLLLERAAGFGVSGLDDLLGLPRLDGHPQARKLRLTESLPRCPGVYLFCGDRGEVLYVGKATNLRQRVRSYFSTNEDRRRTAAMLREAREIRHTPTPDPLSAAVLETRLLHQLTPRYNRQGTRWERSAYVRLDDTERYPRLSVVRRPGRSGLHLGPLPSHASAAVVCEAINSVVPLRRCTGRISRSHRPEPDATPCTAAQLGVAFCPCAHEPPPGAYEAAVESARRILRGDAAHALAALGDRMWALAGSQRYEEAGMVRDRMQSLEHAVRRQSRLETLRRAGTVVVSDGRLSWRLSRGTLDAVLVDGAWTPLDLPAPDPGPLDTPVPPEAADELLCIARHLDDAAGRLHVVHCDGEWTLALHGLAA
jgi:DNA polymerase-3 subunit epsilon